MPRLSNSCLFWFLVQNNSEYFHVILLILLQQEKNVFVIKSKSMKTLNVSL